MEKTKYKDNNVSLLGFGTMRFPTKEGMIDKVKSYELMDYALDNGINYIDTAWFYHDFESEKFVGEYLSTKDRNTYYLATKLPIWLCEDEDDILSYFNKQLLNLGVEYFDFYLVHALNKDRFIQLKTMNVITILQKLKKQGKIRNIGFSFHDDYHCFEEIVSYFKWDFAQIQLNYMDLNHQQGIKGLDLLNSKEIPAIIMEPVKGGKLASFNQEISRKFKFASNDASIASWAFRWVASQKGIITVLSGMTTIEQVVDNINTFTDFIPMNTKEYKFIESVITEIREKQLNICTKCKYCMPCQYGVNIPATLGLQNDEAMYGSDSVVKMREHLMNKDSFADMCTYCGECVSKCPQQIDIPKMMEMIS